MSASVRIVACLLIAFAPAFACQEASARPGRMQRPNRLKLALALHAREFKDVITTKRPSIRIGEGKLVYNVPQVSVTRQIDAGSAEPMLRLMRCQAKVDLFRDAVRLREIKSTYWNATLASADQTLQAAYSTVLRTRKLETRREIATKACTAVEKALADRVENIARDRGLEFVVFATVRTVRASHPDGGGPRTVPEGGTVRAVPMLVYRLMRISDPSRFEEDLAQKLAESPPWPAHGDEESGGVALGNYWIQITWPDGVRRQGAWAWPRSGTTIHASQLGP